MSKLVIHGPCKLNGEVSISGSKNAALPILISTVLTGGITHIHNVPNLTDILTTIRLLRSLGVRAEMTRNTVKIWGSDELRHIAPYELITKMRASFLVAGPIVARMGLAKVPYPGGCSIGSRPVDIHLKGFEAFGIDIRIEHGFVILKASGRLKGMKYTLDFPSVGATENLMMAACLADGTTVLKNVAREPEIVDLADYLNKAGAQVKGAGTDIIRIDGVNSLNGVEYDVIPDRVEAATFIMAAAATNGDVIIKNLNIEHLQGLTQILHKTGINFECEGNTTLKVISNGFKYKGVHVKTEPYPGFPTDMQPLLMSFLSVLDGKKSVILESIFENRYMHVMELIRMGAKITVDGKKATIHGVPKLSGSAVKSMDLRGGAALILAGLAAEGETTVYNVGHVFRGYENICDKLSGLGAKIV